MDVGDLRTDYARGELNDADAPEAPLPLLSAWIEEAIRAGMPEPNAMTVCTVGLDGRPDGRVVLLRDYDGRGLTFYTNYESAKGRDLSANPVAAAVLCWPAMQRQVRAIGPVERVSAAESDRYFASRPRRSRLGAIASAQSRVLPDRATLERAMADLEAQYPEGADIPRPANWGGYRILVDRYEFWQGRRSRLHDRIVYQQTNGGWAKSRLYP